jgi:ATP-binding cassette subfamily C exporter for protease/lipase
MLEVYDRVVNSRSHMTLDADDHADCWAYVLMEVLDWARSEVMHEAGLALDQKMSARVFRAIFEANLRRIPAERSAAHELTSRLCANSCIHRCCWR